MTKSVLGNTWREVLLDEREIYRLVNEYGISELLGRLLVGRGIKADKACDFLDPKIKSLLPDPFHLLDMDKACSRTVQAIGAREKIVIFADYDVDGATSSALLFRLLKSFDCDVTIYIPDRIVEGYGPSVNAMEKFKIDGATLVFTLDCGSMAFEPLMRAKELGLDVIVLDHHLTNELLPYAIAVVNPNRMDQVSEYGYMAAVGVTFLFAVALCKTLRELGKLGDRRPDLLSYLDLVALGTVCDVMPIVGLNRAYVHQGLKVMNNSGNIGLNALRAVSSVAGEVSCYHLGFALGPRINAGGRVGRSFLGAHLLSTHNPNDAKKFADELHFYNEDRKSIEKDVLEEAMRQAELQLHKNYIMVVGDGWHQGVIGIVAGRIKEKFHKPVAVIALDGSYGKASCRSVSGVNFGGAVVEAKTRDILVAGGGHAMAAGFTVERERIDDLVAFFDEHIVYDNSAMFFREYDIAVHPSAVNLELIEEINKLAPFGNGNHEPIVRVEGLFVLRADVLSDKHISCLLSSGKTSFNSTVIKAIAFNTYGTEIGNALLSPQAHRMIVYGYAKENKWNGKSSVQLQIIDAQLG